MTVVTTYRVAIVDDEPLARAGIRTLLEGDPEITIVAECRNGTEAARTLSAGGVDIVFLDVQMPVRNGFDVVREVGADAMPVVVFVTAHEDYALRAFDAHALDYLLKPFSDERFRQALTRAKSQVRRQRAGDLGQRLAALMKEGGAPAHPPAYVGRIMVRSAGRVSFVSVRDIDWVEAQDYYVELHSGGKSFLLREPLKDLQQRLDPRVFVRIHRSTIVNVRKVREIVSEADGSCSAVLMDGTALPVTRQRRDTLEEAVQRAP
jgi:two-component system LytT family response regulator